MKNNDSNHLESDQELINIFDIDNIPESELEKAYVDYEKVKGNNMQKTIIGTGIFNLDRIVVRHLPLSMLSPMENRLLTQPAKR